MKNTDQKFIPAILLFCFIFGVQVDHLLQKISSPLIFYHLEKLLTHQFGHSNM